MNENQQEIDKFLENIQDGEGLDLLEFLGIEYEEIQEDIS